MVAGVVGDATAGVAGCGFMNRMPGLSARRNCMLAKNKSLAQMLMLCRTGRDERVEKLVKGDQKC